MKPTIKSICAGMVVVALCAAFTACKKDEYVMFSAPGVVETKGVEIEQAKGTVIGLFGGNQRSLLVQVDKGFPIGKSYSSENGTRHNVIQVQHTLPVKTGNRVYFSFREFIPIIDYGLFITGSGKSNGFNDTIPVPIYVVTEYSIINI